MVVQTDIYDVLVCAYNEDKKFISYIGTVKNAHQYTPKELKDAIKSKFEFYNEYIHDQSSIRAFSSVYCRFMFVREECKGVEWIDWKKKDGLVTHPSHPKYTQAIYESDWDGNITEIYDNE